MKAGPAAGGSRRAVILKGVYDLEKKNRTIYVIGPKAGDTDAVCASIAIAYLKNAIAASGDAQRLSPVYSGTNEENACYEAAMAGEPAGVSGVELRDILARFGVEMPQLLTNARTQIADICYSKAEPVCGDLSLLAAWRRMREVGKAILAVTSPDDGHLKGIITIGDIARSYMEIFDTHILAEARTPVQNIVDTLKGELVAGSAQGEIREGKVLIASANTEVLQSMVSKGDIVILGNRYEAQLCAIEQGADMIIADNNAPISRTIRKIADEHGCIIIRTPYDAYDIARLINQSLPVRHFMDADMVCFREEDYIDEIRETMTRKRLRDFPVTDAHGSILGTISRRNLIDMDRKRVIMVGHNSLRDAVDGIEQAEVVEIIDTHSLDTVETVKPLVVQVSFGGSVAALAADLFEQNDLPIPESIAGMLCAGILCKAAREGAAESDLKTARKLAQIAGLSYEEEKARYGKEAQA